MVTVSFSFREDYWEKFTLQETDVEFLYNHLLELETPLTSAELVSALVAERIQKEKLALEQQRAAEGDFYQPKGLYVPGQKLVFPALDWRCGEVTAVRPGNNPDIGQFQVIQVSLNNGEQREFAAGLNTHALNAPIEIPQDASSFDVQTVLAQHAEDLEAILEDDLSDNPDFVRIAGKWFPQALLVDVNVGHLNLAEAVLDMAGGGPIPTKDLIDQIDLPSDVNPNLVDFSLDLALQNDQRFDEVGAAGDVLWFLRRLEPPQVLEPPLFLRYAGIDYDRSVLTKEMLALERALDDELSPIQGKLPVQEDVEVRLIFPHWRAGTLPLSARLRHLFPTAYEAPRILFTLVDGDSGEKSSAWVVREKRYVYGLKDFYTAHGVMPGSILHVRRGQKRGEVIVKVDGRRSGREWVRTVLVGSDGGVVFAMLKQVVSTALDDRMAIAVPDIEALEITWQQRSPQGFEQTVVNMVRELAKLNPQGHVHASELYAALNVVRRCPPGPLLALLASRSGFIHVGDLHFRLGDS